MRGVYLTQVRDFIRGQETEVFKRYPQPRRTLLSFSILYAEE